MSELLHRLLAPTPKFWRTVQLRGVLVGASLAATAQLPGLSPLLSNLCTWAAFACGVAVAVAQATCDSPANPSTDSSAS